MYAIVAGLVVLGLLCGATIRLLAFIVVLVIGAAVAIASGLIAGGTGTALLNAVIAVIALQAGYAGGVVARALLWPRQSAHLKGSMRPSRQAARLPTEQKPH